MSKPILVVKYPENYYDKDRIKEILRAMEILTGVTDNYIVIKVPTRETEFSFEVLNGNESNNLDELKKATEQKEVLDETKKEIDNPVKIITEETKDYINKLKEYIRYANKITISNDNYKTIYAKKRNCENLLVLLEHHNITR